LKNLKKELSRQPAPAVNIEEVRKPEIDAKLIADSITQQWKCDHVPSCHEALMRKTPCVSVLWASRSCRLAV
jgi:hypothetical protein